MKKLFILIFSISILFIACNDTTSKSDKKEAVKTKTSNSDSNDMGQEYRLPPLPKGVFNEIYKHADYLDVIFEDLEFSMSQDNNASIRSFLQNINLKRTAVLKPGCKPMGHANFIKGGNSIIEADFYHTSGCYYFIFNFEGGQPMYSNSMSEIGINFFKSIKTRNFKPQ